MSPYTSIFEATSPAPENLAFRLALLLISALTLSGCGSFWHQKTQVLGENDQYLVLLAGGGETPRSLADAFLGDPRQDWRVADAIGGTTVKAGQHVIIPRSPSNPTGVFVDGYQTVPVLSYHRFGAGKGKLSVSREKFQEQMEYLHSNGYRVIPLERLIPFLKGEGDIPLRSVVLTIDDGYRSVYDIAYPVLKKYGFPATIFIYSDFIANGGLNWRQLKEMEASGLISVQAHSKSHDNLTQRYISESLAHYDTRLSREIRGPSELLDKRLKSSQESFAYPFGAVNQRVVDELLSQGYEIGVTVNRGANAFFTYPYALRRVMIYEKDGMPEFKRALRVFTAKTLK